MASTPIEGQNPSCASRVAVTAPSPRELPVTSATRRSMPAQCPGRGGRQPLGRVRQRGASWPHAWPARNRSRRKLLTDMRHPSHGATVVSHVPGGALGIHTPAPRDLRGQSRFLPGAHRLGIPDLARVARAAAAAAHGPLPTPRQRLEAQEKPLFPAASGEPSAGLEPATPSLPWRLPVVEIQPFAAALCPERFPEFCAFCGVSAGGVPLVFLGPIKSVADRRDQTRRRRSSASWSSQYGRLRRSAFLVSR